MNFETLHNIIRTRFKTQVVDEGTLKVHYDNAPFEEPDGVIWTRLTIHHSTRQQVEIGKTKRFRVYGQMIAQLFEPVEGGDQGASQLADTINDAFISVTDTGVTFQTPFIDRVGRDGKWYQVNVVCPFYADATK